MNSLILQLTLIKINLANNPHPDHRSEEVVLENCQSNVKGTCKTLL